jgi:hypothetical protein
MAGRHPSQSGVLGSAPAPPPAPPAAAGGAQAPHAIPTTGPLAVAPPGGGGGGGGGDVDMAAADIVVPPIIHSDQEPALSRQKVSDFLASHTSYELIPESGKVVLLDADLPVRQAFHALHEQGTASAPIWDSQEGTITGVLSASDFIHVLRRLRNAVSSGSNPLSEQEMDAHTVGRPRGRGGGRALCVRGAGV